MFLSIRAPATQAQRSEFRSQHPHLKKIPLWQHTLVTLALWGRGRDTGACWSLMLRMKSCLMVIKQSVIKPNTRRGCTFVSACMHACEHVPQTRSVSEPGAYLISQTGWSVSSRDQPVLPLPAQSTDICCLLFLALHMDSEDLKFGPQV